MANESNESRYDQTRRQFEAFSPEERTRFLIEATASTLAQGIESVGRTLAHGLQDTVRRARQRSGGDGSKPGPAEPETSQRQQPRNGRSASPDDA
ncbi:MAG: hypothetical protein R6T83_11575 [Salinibacter sp.]